MKWYNGVMGILTILCVGMVFFVLTGCANTADMKTAKIESEYRKQLLNTTNRPAPGYNGPIEMPQEWIDQWPSLRKHEEQMENGIIGDMQ